MECEMNERSWPDLCSLSSSLSSAAPNAVSGNSLGVFSGTEALYTQISAGDGIKNIFRISSSLSLRPGVFTRGRLCFKSSGFMMLNLK